MPMASPSSYSDDVRLAVAVARAENFEVLSKVIDESIERAAEARRQREKRQAEKRREEDRRERLAQIEESEAASAAAAAERVRLQAQSQAENDAAERAAEENRLRLKLERPPSGPLDLAA